MRRAPRPPPDFAGREAELRRAEQLLGRVPILVLSGVAGVGKTSTALAILDRLGRAGMSAVFARCGEGEGTAAAVDGLAEAVGTKVSRSLPLEARIEAIAGIMDAGGVAALLDDLHRLPDEGAARLLRALRQRIGRGRLVVTSRHGLRVPPEERLDHGHLVIAGLPPAAALPWMIDLLDRAGAGRPREQDLLALHQRLAGHPLLIKLSLATQAAGGPPDPGHEGSDFVEREVMRGLPARARAVLDQLACFRIPVPLEALGGEAARPATEDLLRRRLIERHPEGRFWAHDLIREHALARMPPEARRRHHAASADWLRRAPGGPGVDATARADALVHHLYEAGRAAEAVAVADQASPEAWARDRNEEMLRWGDLLLGAGRPLPVRLAVHLAATYGREWRIDEARALLDDAERRASQAERPLCLLGRSRIHSATGEWPEVIATHVELVRAPGATADQILRSALNCVQAHLRLGLYRDAIATLRGIRPADRAGLENGIQTMFGLACLGLGRHRFARRALDRGEKLSEAAHDVTWLFIASLQSAYLALVTEGPRQAVARLDRARGTVPAPLPSQRVDLALLGALQAAAAGRTAEALRDLDALVSGMKDVPVSGDTVALMFEARSSLRRDLDDLAGAEEDLRECARHARRHGMRPFRLQAMLGLGHLAALRGRTRHARRLLEGARRSLAASGARLGEMRATGALAELALRSGAADAAEGLARRALHLARAVEARAARPRISRLLAECALHRGRLAEAVDLAEQALREGGEIGDRRAEAGALDVLARARIASGQPAEAAQDAARLRALAREIQHPRMLCEAGALEAAALRAGGNVQPALRAARALRGAPLPWVRAFAHRLQSPGGTPDGGGADFHGVLDPRGSARLAELASLAEGPRGLYEVFTSEGRFLVGEGELARFAAADGDITFDSTLPHAVVRGKRVDLGSRPVLRDMLAFFLERRPGLPADLEAIYRAVWHGPYEPLRHERRVYVTLRRLDALLRGAVGRPVIVQSSKGEWRIADGLRGTFIRRPRRSVPETLNDRQAALLRGLAPGERVTNRTYRARFKVHRFTATRDLAGLVGLGLLAPAGKGAGAGYALA